jgi:3-hydroxyisobutyrate dehydrogenase/2-hydroxy-3-oxopropionate reductase
VSIVGVAGLGKMGRRLARRLLDTGHDVVVWNRSPEPAAELAELGAVAAASPAELTRQVEVVLTMVANPAALREVTEGSDGVAASADDETVVIDMSTSGPAAVERLRSVLPAETGLLDAPVLGSLSEVESGSLQIFVGGPEPLVKRWSPLLAALGTPLHVGPLGSGARAKLVANSTLVGLLSVLGEALALADGLGLSRDAAWAVLSGTPLAAQAERRRELIEGAEVPVRFSLSLARKDAELIAETAVALGLELRVAEGARAWFAEAEEAGRGDQDYAAVLLHILERR